MWVAGVSVTRTRRYSMLGRRVPTTSWETLTTVLASSADLDLDLDSDLPNRALPNSVSRASRHALLLLEEKVKHFEEAKKKTERFHKRLKQQFLKEQERKVARWKKASERFEKSLEASSRRSGKSSVPSADGLSASKAMPLEHGEETKRRV
ncbi:uncharacterized protein C5orf52 homolog [Balearica regulorum gibbericeps]|uniref:uncharacterized protein C5orf52 homolog n=1 Tax=Balearica regulorum gibbericeps TaxID=100784 RepID=UPI003F604F7E